MRLPERLAAAGLRGGAPVRVSEGGPRGRGLFASRPLQPREPVLRVPVEEAAVADVGSAPAGCTLPEALALELLGRAKEPGAAWHDIWREPGALPALSDLGLPVACADAALAELQGHRLAAEALEERERLADVAVEHGLDAAELIRAFALGRSRCLGDEAAFLVCVPFLDLANTELEDVALQNAATAVAQPPMRRALEALRGLPRTYDGPLLPGGHVELLAADDGVAEGEELLISYGAELATNEELLFTYGFSRAQNPNDRVSGLPAGLDVAAVCSASREPLPIAVVASLREAAEAGPAPEDPAAAAREAAAALRARAAGWWTSAAFDEQLLAEGGLGAQASALVKFRLAEKRLVAAAAGALDSYVARCEPVLPGDAAV